MHCPRNWYLHPPKPSVIDSTEHLEWKQRPPPLWCGKRHAIEQQNASAMGSSLDSVGPHASIKLGNLSLFGSSFGLRHLSSNTNAAPLKSVLASCHSYTHTHTYGDCTLHIMTSKCCTGKVSHMPRRFWMLSIACIRATYARMHTPFMLQILARRILSVLYIEPCVCVQNTVINWYVHTHCMCVTHLSAAHTHTY